MSDVDLVYLKVKGIIMAVRKAGMASDMFCTHNPHNHQPFISYHTTSSPKIKALVAGSVNRVWWVGGGRTCQSMWWDSASMMVPTRIRMGAVAAFGTYSTTVHGHCTDTHVRPTSTWPKMVSHPFHSTMTLAGNESPWLLEMNAPW